MPTTTVAPPSLTDVLQQANVAIDALQDLDLSPVDVAEGLALVRSVEVVGRRLASVQLGVVTAIDQSQVYRADGHGSAGVMVGYAANLADKDAKRRDRASRALRDLPAVAAGFAMGLIGVSQVDRIALVHSNPRVREQFIALDAEVAVLAARLRYDEMDSRLTNWVRQVDEDGTADRSSRNHQNRRARCAQDYDGGWRGEWSCGSIDGIEIHAIEAAFIEAEFQADWAEAFAEHGDATTVAHLARTHDQRQFDAFKRIHRLALEGAGLDLASTGIDTTIVIDRETFERELRRIAGEDVEPRRDVRLFDPDLDDPIDTASPFAPHGCDGAHDHDHVVASAPADPEEVDAPPSGDSGGGAASDRGSRFRCETVDGHVVDPREAVVNALVGRVRRQVVGADGVVLDQGRLSRLFTGPLAHAIRASLTRCYWPGCNVPASWCEGDHLLGWRRDGRTNPGNGAPACGRHNRFKEHGFSVRRDKRGRLHVYRPDGTEID